MRRWALMAIGILAAMAALVASPGSLATTSAGSAPLIGANYGHYSIPVCDGLDGSGIVDGYASPGVRPRVKQQLTAMRAAGVQTLRLLLWHASETSGQTWGVIPSTDGRLSELYRTNLIRYVTDVREAGFGQLTVSFAPQGTNDPNAYPVNIYDPAKFQENWDFIHDVRPLLKRYGPPTTHIDLLNEGAPGDYDATLPQERDYIARMYTNYVGAFGRDDVVVSAIAQNDPSRLANLIETLRGTGVGMPYWFEIHPSYTATQALRDLQQADQTLAAKGLNQPLVIGEEAYNDQPVADAISAFTGSSARSITEVIEWPLTADRPCRNISVAPPYRADSYIRALTASPVPPPTPDPLPPLPVPTLYASVGPKQTISLRTAAGAPVAALESGSYRVIVKDRTNRDNFHLTGPDIDRATTRRFTGRVVWTLDLGTSVVYDSTYTYRSDLRHSKLVRHFKVL